jgi:hypothetical protein
MKTTLGLLTALAGTLVTSAALACGMPFGTGINVDAKQDIIVTQKDGIETYVFQPTFCGTATNFGLIMPVPSKLTEQPALASAEIFKYVDSISQPQIVQRTVCQQNWKAGGAGDAGLSNGGINPPNDTQVVSSGRVGFLDYAQLKAETETSFTDWLDANQFPYNAAAKEVFSYYVKKGWYFLAFKIASGTTGDRVCNALGPIKMSFTTDTPVVPSRMALAGGTSSYFTWRVFGITGAGKQIGFETASAGVRDLDYSGALTAADVAKLDGLATVGERLTKLSIWFGSTYSGTSNADVALTLQAAQDFRKTVYKDTYVVCDAGVPDTQPADTRPAERADAGAASTQTIVTTVTSTAVTTATSTATPTSTATATNIPNDQESSDDGCSIGAGSTGARALVPLLLGLGLLLRTRRRK